jgi:hypothetical protein
MVRSSQIYYHAVSSEFGVQSYFLCNMVRNSQIYYHAVPSEFGEHALSSKKETFEQNRTVQNGFFK